MLEPNDPQFVQAWGNLMRAVKTLPPTCTHRELTPRKDRLVNLVWESDRPSLETSWKTAILQREIDNLSED